MYIFDESHLMIGVVKQELWAINSFFLFFRCYHIYLILVSYYWVLSFLGEFNDVLVFTERWAIKFLFNIYIHVCVYVCVKEIFFLVLDGHDSLFAAVSERDSTVVFLHLKFRFVVLLDWLSNITIRELTQSSLVTETGYLLTPKLCVRILTGVIFTLLNGYDIILRSSCTQITLVLVKSTKFSPSLSLMSTSIYLSVLVHIYHVFTFLFY